MSLREAGWGEATGARIGRLLDACLGGASAAPAIEGPVIAVASGKGGTGKSFLASSLAVLVSEQRRRVTLVDCDFGLATTHLLLGVQPRGTLQNLLAGRARPEDVVHHSPFGPCLVPGATGVQEMASLGRAELDRLGVALGVWAATVDALVLDVGAGLSMPGLLTLAAADHVVLVTQPDLAALTDAYALVKCLCATAGPAPTFSVVVNRVRAAGQGEASFKKLCEVSRRFLEVPLHYLGEIADEPAVGLRRLGQAPLVVRHPSCRTAHQLRIVLGRMIEVAGPLQPRVTAAGSGVARRFRVRLTATH